MDNLPSPWVFNSQLAREVTEPCPCSDFSIDLASPALGEDFPTAPACKAISTVECNGACGMAMEISSIGSGFLAHRSWISRGYRYRELGLMQLLNQSRMSAAGLHFPGVETTRWQCGMQRELPCMSAPFILKIPIIFFHILGSGSYFFKTG